MKSHWLVSLIAITLAVAVSDAMAQPSGGSGGRRGQDRQGGRMFGGPQMGELGLLMNEDVRNELGLVDDQLEKLRSIGDASMQQAREMYSEMRGLGPEERREKMAEIREKMEKLRATLNDRVKESLLPNQWHRLKQINLQVQMQTRGATSLLNNSDLAEALGLTSDQKEQLKTKAQEVQKNLQEKINKLREEAKDELLSVLTSEQQAKLKELMGEKYELPDSVQRFGRGGDRPRGDRGPRRGPRGDRGGPRPEAE